MNRNLLLSKNFITIFAGIFAAIVMFFIVVPLLPTVQSKSTHALLSMKAFVAHADGDGGGGGGDSGGGGGSDSGAGNDNTGDQGAVGGTSGNPGGAVGDVGSGCCGGTSGGDEGAVGGISGNPGGPVGDVGGGCCGGGPVDASGPTNTDAPAPIVAVISPVSGICTVSNSTIQTGQSVTWMIQASGGSGVFSYAWADTTGATYSSGSTPSWTRTYSSAGQYSAALYVSSTDGQTVAVQCPTVTVQAPPPPPTCPAGTTGTYPNCVNPPPPTCPAGTTGTYPNCVTPPVNHVPKGVVDVADCNTFAGWAYDEDDSSRSLDVHIYEGTTFIQAISANQARSDVNAAFGISGNHGFSISTPTRFKDGQTHTVTFYAIDSAGGSNPVIGTKTFNCPLPPAPTCPTGTTGTYPNCVTPPPTCPAGTTGTYPNCVTPTPVCPSGTTGTYPNCVVPTPVCPTGTTGTYPNCVTPTPLCPTGTTGTYPNCVTPTPVCPSGTTGTYPNCVVPNPTCPTGFTGTYPNCVAPTPVCPSGTTGTYPNCTVPTPVCPSGTTGTYPNCVVPTPNCPSGTYGTYPNCVVPTPNCPTNTTGAYPNCTPITTPYCPSGTTGTYPNCVVPTPNCPSGTYGTYPNCTVPTPVCPSGTSGAYPNCQVPTPYCPSGTTGTYPNCFVPQPVCPSNMSGVYPNCLPPYTPPISYPQCTITSSAQVVDRGQQVQISWTTQNTNSGWIENIGSVGYYGSVSMTPMFDTTYVGHFTGGNGQTITCSVSVAIRSVFVPPPFVPQVPFITLSAVPYTGIALGPIGTALYYILLAAWCLFMAYLVVVKRLHVYIANTLDKVVFSHAGVPADAPQTSYESVKEDIENTEVLEPVAESQLHPTKIKMNDDAIDDFILTQIQRA